MIYTFHKPTRAALAAKKGDAKAGLFETEYDDVKAVPESVSFWAIIFPAPWLLWHRLWLEFVVYILLMVLVGGLLATQLAPIAFALSGVPGFYLWLEGHNLRRNKLERHGYVLSDVVDADNEETAFMRYFDKAITRRKADLASLKDLGLATQEVLS